MMIFAAGLMAAALAATDGSAGPTPAPAPVTTPAPAGATTPAIPDPETQMICHKVSTTGSRLDFQKVCKTRLEWDQMSRISQDVVNDRQKRSFLYGPKGG